MLDACRRFTPKLVLSLLLAFPPAWVATLWFGHQLGDPDFFYHLGLTKILAAHGGVLRELPQVYGIGWDRWFVDKEFGFHVLTEFAWAIRGESGLRWLPIVLTWVVGATVVVLAGLEAEKGAERGRNVRMISAMIAAALILSLGSRWSMRMSMLRPHVLGVLLFLFIVAALRVRSRIAGFLAGFAYALAYHVIVVPGVALAAVFLPWVERDSLLRKTAAATGVGLLSGLVLHPGFPGNVAVMIQHLRIPLGGYGDEVTDFGVELSPMASDQWVAQLALPLVVVVLVASFHWLRFGDSGGKDAKEPGWLPWLALGLLALTGISPRGLEFALPLAAMLAGPLVRLWGEQGFRRSVAGTMLVAAALLTSWSARKGLGEEEGRRNFAAELERSSNWRRAAARAIPEVDAGDEKVRVWNCSWDVSPHILADRVDLAFVDLLDPTFLFLQDADAYRLRRQIQAGSRVDLAGSVGKVFGARYTYCSIPLVNERLERDPRFERVFPEKLESVAKGLPDVRVYELTELRDGLPWASVSVSELSLREGPALTAVERKARGFVGGGDSREDFVSRFPGLAEVREVSGKSFRSAVELLGIENHPGDLPAGFDWVKPFPVLTAHLLEDPAGRIRRNEDRYACVWARFKTASDTHWVGFQGHPRHKLFWQPDDGGVLRELKKDPEAWPIQTTDDWPGIAYRIPRTRGKGLGVALLCANDADPEGFGGLSTWDPTTVDALKKRTPPSRSR